MKKTLIALAIAPLFSASVFAAGYTGPNSTQPVNTVAQALEAKDDTPVVLEGQVVERIKGDNYSFRDDSGTIQVEIDDDEWPAGASVDQNVRVRLTGEVDRGMASKVEVDVDTLEVLGQ